MSIVTFSGISLWNICEKPAKIYKIESQKIGSRLLQKIFYTILEKMEKI